MRLTDSVWRVFTRTCPSFNTGPGDPSVHRNPDSAATDASSYVTCDLEGDPQRSLFLICKMTVSNAYAQGIKSDK